VDKFIREGLNSFLAQEMCEKEDGRDAALLEKHNTDF